MYTYDFTQQRTQIFLLGKDHHTRLDWSYVENITIYFNMANPLLHLTPIESETWTGAGRGEACDASELGQSMMGLTRLPTPS